MKILFQRKVLAGVSALILAAGLLAGCATPANGQGETQSKEITIEATEEQTAAAETTEEVTTQESVEESSASEEESDSAKETGEEESSEQETSSEEETSTFAPVNIEEVTETVWATTSVNVRQYWDKDAKKVGGLRKNQEAVRTGICDNGWSRIEYDGGEAYVNSTYLTTEEPVPETTTAAQSAEGSGDAQDVNATVPETPAPSGPAAGKTWCSLGDSITAQQGWQSVVTNTLGFSGEYVTGKSGATLTSDGDKAWLGDYAPAVNAASDYVLILAGINDMVFAKPIGDVSTPGTVKHGLNETITKVRAQAPNAKVIVATPLNTYAHTNEIGNSLSTYVDAIKEVAQNQGCPVIDLFSDATFTPDNQSTYTVDEIHLNDEGKQKLGEVLAGYLGNLL